MKPPPYDVSVDGISGPGGVGGTSYQLIARDAMAPRDPLLHERVVTCVKAAFADKGMFEAPAGTQPDIFITIDYGLGNTIPAMNGPPAVEKFLYMSARKEREDPRAGTRGEELWNVRTSFAIPGVAIDAPMPLLAIVAGDYIGRDTISEQTVKIPRDSPALARILATLTTGLKETEAKAKPPTP